MAEEAQREDEGSGAPSRRVNLSRFDCQSLCGTWKNEKERVEATSKLDAMSKLDAIASAFDTIIQNLGDPSPEREGLRKTPQRAAKALCYFTKGYEESIESKCDCNQSTT